MYHHPPSDFHKHFLAICETFPPTHVWILTSFIIAKLCTSDGVLNEAKFESDFRVPVVKLSPACDPQ